MPFKPGTSGNAAGRPRGLENSLTVTIRDTVKKTFDLIQRDPKYAKIALPQFALDYPRDFYLMASRLIPTTEIVGNITQDIVWHEEKKYEPEQKGLIYEVIPQADGSHGLLRDRQTED